jgi:hypothetical protein
LNTTEGSLLTQVVEDVMHRYAHRETLPVAVQDLRQFQTEANTITVKVTGVPFTGPEVLAFIMIADRLFDLRPQFKETLGDKLTIEKTAEEAKFKALSDEEVWFSHLEVVDEQTLALEFIVLTFETMARLRRRLEDGSIGTRRSSMKLSQGVTADEKPWYGSKRYDIVDHVLKLQEQREGQQFRSAVQEAALKA